MKTVFSRRSVRDTMTVPLTGIDYREALSALHLHMQPRSYLEIGTATGATLALAGCTSVAIDPAFALSVDVVGTKPELHLIQAQSAEILGTPRLTRLLPDGPDLVFIDGLHLIEAVLDDFIGVEGHAHARTLVAVHDVLPINTEMTARTGGTERRDQSTREWWTGDVWKLIPILKRHRPDLDITVFDCQPTGLMVIRQLRPGHATLAASRTEILAEWQELALDSYGIEKLYLDARVTPARSTSDVTALVKAA